MSDLLIKNGHVIDPANKIDESADLRIKDGIITEIGHNFAENGEKVIDATGMIITPGLIDIHTHLREPGFEYKEDILSGSESAIAGGFTSVACMANTHPTNDNAEVTRYIQQKAREANLCNIYVIGAISTELKGEKLSAIGDMAAQGIVALSDDGKCVMDTGLMRSAMEYAKMFDLPVIEHAEDHLLVQGGVMNEGVVSAELGLSGQPRSAEDIIVARDIELAEYLDTKIHIAHVSTKGAVRLIRDAKARGVQITGEVTPHHFTLTDSCCRGYNTAAKMAPPLRENSDIDALIDGLADGTLDCIATDHAPHATNEKEVEFDCAAFGIVGLETALPLSLRLVREKRLSMTRLIESLTISAARIIGVDRGTLSVGAIADVTIINPALEWRVDPEQFKSKGGNTPFAGWDMIGAATHTIVAGKTLYQRSE